MKIAAIIIILQLGVYVSAQTFEKPFTKENKPVSAIHHKFNPSEPTFHVEMHAPEHRTCLTPEMNEALRIQYNLPGTDAYETEFAKLKNDYLSKKKSTTATVISIPVIVHVVHNGEAVGTGANISAAQVISQIEVLNEDFRRKEGTVGFNTHPDGADVEIEFALALRDEFGNTLSEPGIHRVNGNIDAWDRDGVEEILKPQTIWNPKKYMNIWTVHFGGDLDNLLGYAQFPSLSGLGGLDSNEGLSKTDGVVIGYRYFGRVGEVAEPYDGGRTATHEVGHWLGLRHIWGDGGCLVDDYCDDTPRAGTPNYTCESTNSCILHAGFDMVENYMDYTNDACMNTFTQDQKERMQVVMQVSPRRKELLTSDVHLVLNRPIAFFSTTKTEICSGETIEFTDNSQNNPTAWEWTFYDPSNQEVASFTDKNPTLIFNGIGVYGLQLIVSNSLGSDTIFESNYVSVLSSEALSVPFEETFEYLNVLDQWVFYNPDGDRTWQETSSAGSEGTWSLFVDNYSDVDGDPTGNLDVIFSPKLNLSTYQDAYLTFDIAYAKYGGAYSDTLVIYTSSDCGENFYPIWVKGGNDLATAPTTQQPFVPSGNQWVTERISLKELNGESSIHLAIVNLSGWGNNLYLDNINVIDPVDSEPAISYFYAPRDTISIGSTVAFADYSDNYPNTWSWDFEGGSPATSSIQNPYITYPSIGSFDVALSASNTMGGDTQLKDGYITVVDNPVIAVSSSHQDYTVCKGELIVLTANGGDFYEWYDDRGYLISEEGMLEVQPLQTTTYEVIGYDRFGGSSSIIKAITVNPVPEFNLGKDTALNIHESVLLEVGAGFTSYLWSDASTEQTLLVQGEVYNAGAHEIWVEVSNEYGCRHTDTLAVTFNYSSGVKDLPDPASSIRVYPTPTSGILYVELKNIFSPVYCEIVNSNGQSMTSTELFNRHESMDISEYPPGIYCIRLVNDEFDRSLTILKTD